MFVSISIEHETSGERDENAESLFDVNWDKLKCCQVPYKKLLILLIFSFTCEDAVFCDVDTAHRPVDASKEICGFYERFKQEKRFEHIRFHLCIVHLTRCAATIKRFMLNIMNFYARLSAQPSAGLMRINFTWKNFFHSSRSNVDLEHVRKSQNEGIDKSGLDISSSGLYWQSFNRKHLEKSIRLHTFIELWLIL